MISNAMVIHYIDDMDTSLTFYKTAIGLESKFESSGWSTLGVNEGLELGLHTSLKDGPRGTVPHPFDAGDTTLSLTIDDLEACIARIEEYGGRLERIVEPMDGRRSRMGLVWDPSGNGFQVNQIVL
jgi:predicted enzyme related to lactoylglutathione lyase